MTDQAPAYAQALDQLRAERDAAQARADATERQWAAIAQTPDGGWHFAHQRATAQLAEATAERDDLRAQLAAVMEFIDKLELLAHIPRNEAPLSERLERIGMALGQSVGTLATVTAERDHMRSVIPELEAQLDHWKGKYVTPRTSTDLEERTGPVAFERNQLRDEVARLNKRIKQLEDQHEGCISDDELAAITDERETFRENAANLRNKLTDLTTDLKATTSELALTTRDLDAARRTIATLRAVAHAIVDAVAKETT